MNPLNLLLACPIFAVVYLFCFCRKLQQSTQRAVGIVLAVGIFSLALYVARQFILYAKTFYYKIPVGLFEYNIEINGVSVLFILLTSFLLLISLISIKNSIQERILEYIIHFFFLEFALFGVFIARDIIMFYIFFELTLVPMFFIIGIWGGGGRMYSTFKLFLYTFAGSLLFLGSIIYLVHQYNTTSIIQLVYDISHQMGSPLSLNVERTLWVLCFIAFAIKIPMVPLHTWLPNAHVEAPTTGSVMLAGILIKLGGYAMLTILLPLFPNASVFFKNPVIILSIVAVIYTSIVALKQSDIKKMIAYSSIAHMGYVTASMFTLTQDGFSASIFQMFSHGVVSGALFLCIGVLYERLHTREFTSFGGIVQKMPKFAFLLMVLTMASVGLPGTSGFVGELMAIISVSKVSLVFAILIATGMVLGACYMLLMYKQTMFGSITNPEVNTIQDLSRTEIVTIGSLALLAVVLGVYPKIVLDIIPVFNVAFFV